MEKVFKSEFKASNIHKLIFELFSSYLLSLILVAMLIILVFLGTLAQTEMGIYEAQKVFFDSIFFMYSINESISIPLPGGYLLLLLLAVNIICGGIIRLKYGRRTIGILIIHIGVLYLLTAGLVSFHFSNYGFVRLNEGDSTNTFASWTEWDLHITEFNENGDTSFRIPLSTEVAGVELQDDNLPFKLRVTQYAVNSEIVESNGRNSVEGFDIKNLGAEKDAAMNVPAIKLLVNDKKVILWGGSILPHVELKDNKEWQFRVIRKTMPLPFKLTLKKFTMEQHPNTDSASFYESMVFVDDKREVLIQMNEPLRKDGVAVFQTSYEKHIRGDSVSYTSVFSTVINPSDQWPLYACIVLSLGLLIHFIPMLISYVKKGQKES